MIGHYHDQRFIADKLRPAPHEFRKHIKSQYADIFNSQGRRAANLHLLGLHDTLKSVSIGLASSDDEIRLKAKNKAKECAKIVRHKGLDMAEFYLADNGLEMPETDTEAGAAARLSCEYWWRRQLRKKHGRTVEGVAIDLNIVSKHREIYASNASLNRRRNQRSRNREILETCLAINELGQEYTLQQLADLSVSNPKLRRMELMTRIAGFEEHAKTIGYVGEFYTFTCPSRFHSTLSKSGKRNPRYDGSTPAMAQKYLSKVWARIRSKLDREGIDIFGFRVCEPQQDGTPHWHLLLFTAAGHAENLRAICRHYNLQDSPNEPGARKHRFDAKAIDWKRGTATGYIAKYIAKNIDGFGIDRDLFGNDPVKAAERVDAWASTWGIRQFQQIGGPRVSVWRELRKVRGQDIPRPLLEAHSAADTGNWRRFCEVMQGGGIGLAKAWNDKPGRYGEPLGLQVTGIAFQNIVFPTRHHTWEIKNGRTVKSGNESGGFAFAGPVEESGISQGVCHGRTVDGTERSHNRVHGNRSGKPGNKGSIQNVCGYLTQSAHVAEFFRRGAAAPPWSSVNNCTGVHNERTGKTGRRPGGAGKNGQRSAHDEENSRYRGGG